MDAEDPPKYIRDLPECGVALHRVDMKGIRLSVPFAAPSRALSVAATRTLSRSAFTRASAFFWFTSTLP